MQALQTISLTESQIDTVIKNWSKILNAKVIDMFKGKPKFSAENEKKYNWCKFYSWYDSWWVFIFI